MFDQLAKAIQKKFKNEGTGHDWHHIERVLKNSLFISSKEGGDEKVISYAALLHDIDDHKFNGGDFEKGAVTAKKLIEGHPLTTAQKELIIEIVRTISFKGSAEDDTMSSLEGMIVQDADRIDALGAIGIARTFAYGGSIGQPIYNPEVNYNTNQTKEEYINNRTHTINHFYEKLLLIGDRMKTSTGKKIAAERTQFMKNYLNQFYEEWNAYN